MRVGWIKYVAPSFLFVSTAAAEVRLECPESVNVTETIVGQNTDWEAVIDAGRGGHHLDRVSFYDGHPNEMASLVPDESKRTKSVSTMVWKFPNRDSKRFWISCSYTNSNAMLAQQLPEGLSQCEVTYDSLESGSVLIFKSTFCK